MKDYIYSLEESIISLTEAEEGSREYIKEEWKVDKIKLKINKQKASNRKQDMEN